MTWSQVSRFYLSHLPLKRHFLFLKNALSENQYLLGRNCSFLHYATSMCHFSHRSYSSRADVEQRQALFNNLFLKDSTFFNLPARIYPTSVFHYRHFSKISPESIDKSSTKETVEVGNAETNTVQDGIMKNEDVDGSATSQKLTLYQRFKKTYKEHGKILVAVHLVTSVVWFGSFYTVARCGVDVIALMEKWNFSDRIISPFRSGGLGDIAVAYLMYKLATPARYTVTIGGTNLAIRYLRKEGRIPQVAQEDTLRSMYQEGKEDLKHKSSVQLKKMKTRNRNRSRVVHSKDKDKP